jgi:hypothetical protein
MGSSPARPGGIVRQRKKQQQTDRLKACPQQTKLRNFRPIH